MSQDNNVEKPLVSCVCVTRDKPQHLKRAIECFKAQTYSPKELVIVYLDDDFRTRELMQTVTDSNIRSWEVSADLGLSLGEQRNISVSRCNGEYCCQWDDDDWYHVRRLEVQLDAVIRNYKMASVLGIELIYDSVRDVAYLSHIGPWPGTLLCKTSVLRDEIRYPGISKHEDFEVFKKLCKGSLVIPVLMPILYLYHFHGKNTFDPAHFDTFFARSQRLSDDVGKMMKDIFDGKMTPGEASDQLAGRNVLEQMNFFHQWYM